MTNLDLISMIGNLSSSMSSVQKLISGLGYVCGIIFIVHAIVKLKEHINNSQSGLKMPLAYLVSGAGLLYMPSLLSTLSESFFGSAGLLQYTEPKSYNIVEYMHVIIDTAGVIWFVRGCVLLAHASDPNSRSRGSKGIGARGLAFVVMGVFATHLDATVSAIEGLFQIIFSMF